MKLKRMLLCLRLIRETEMSCCKTVTYYNEFTNEVERCRNKATWQGDNGGLACDGHKDGLINPRPLDEASSQKTK